MEWRKISFAELVTEVYNLTPKDQKIDKSYQAADWRLRPLLAEFKTCAQADSYYLYLAWERIKQELLAHKSIPPSLSYIARFNMRTTHYYQQFSKSSDWKNIKFEQKHEVDLDVFYTISEYRITRAKYEDEHPTSMITADQIAKLVYISTQTDTAPDKDLIRKHIPKFSRLNGYDFNRIFAILSVARQRLYKPSNPIKEPPIPLVPPIQDNPPIPEAPESPVLVAVWITDDEETSSKSIPTPKPPTTSYDDQDPPPRLTPFVLPADGLEIVRTVHQVPIPVPRPAPEPMVLSPDDDDEDLLELHAPDEMHLDPEVVPDLVPAPNPVPASGRWCTICHSAGHTPDRCWKNPDRKAILKALLKDNPEKRAKKNRRSNQSKKRTRKTALIQGQIQHHKVQLERLVSKLQTIHKK